MIALCHRKTATLARRFGFRRLAGSLAIFVCLLLLFPAPSLAATRKVLFQLSNLQQWIEVGYEYSGRDLERKSGTDRSSQDHAFEQTYHVGIDYALLNQRLANGGLELDLKLNEEISSEQGALTRSDKDAGVEAEFKFDMNILDHHPYPITLQAERRQRRITAPFTKAYNETNSSYSAAMALRNDTVPLNLAYARYYSETSGLEQDISLERDEFRLRTQLRHGEVGSTDLYAMVDSSETSYEGAGTNSSIRDNYELGGANSLEWGGRERNLKLRSRYSLRKESGNAYLNTVRWGEGVSARLGKALTLGTDYNYNKVVSAEQEKVENSGRGWLEHQLYDSLTTRFDYYLVDRQYLEGDDREFRRGVSFDYAKKLPKSSRLGLSYGYRYGETDRDIDARQLSVNGEQLTVDPFGRVFIDNYNVVAGSVAVYNAARTVLYTENIDYRLNQLGSRSEIQILASIAPGDTLSVDYDYQINGSIEYATATHAFSVNLALFEQRYLVYANASFSDQELIDGAADITPLNQSTNLQVGIERTEGGLRLGGSYLYFDSSMSKEETFESFVAYQTNFSRSMLAMKLNERYSLLTQKEGLSGSPSSEQDQNLILLDVNYRRPLFRRVNLTLKGMLADRRGQNDQNQISAGLKLDAKWYKFEFELSSDVSWVISESGSERDDQLQMKLKRYF